MEGSPRMLLPCPLTPLAVEVWELRDDLPDNPFDQYEVRQLIAPDEQEAEEVALGLLTVFAALIVSLSALLCVTLGLYVRVLDSSQPFHHSLRARHERCDLRRNRALQFGICCITNFAHFRQFRS